MEKICCIGHITRDKIVTPANTVYMAGGVAFYFSYAINHLPRLVDYSLVTKLAEEDRHSAEEMQENGINVMVFPSKATVFFENIYGENPDDRKQRVAAKSDQFRIEEMDGVEAKIFHLGTLLSDDFSLEFVKTLSQRGRISIDAQGFLREVRGEKVFPVDWEEKREWLKYIDIVKVNEMEMVVLTGETDPHKAAEILASWGPSEVLVTLGSLGSLILHNGEFIEVPPYMTDNVVDATGCGDTYMAGYLYCRAQDKSPRESGCFAAAMCTLKLAHNGPFSGSIDDIKAICKDDISF